MRSYKSSHVSETNNSSLHDVQKEEIRFPLFQIEYAADGVDLVVDSQSLHEIQTLRLPIKVRATLLFLNCLGVLEDVEPPACP